MSKTLIGLIVIVVIGGGAWFAVNNLNQGAPVSSNGVDEVEESEPSSSEVTPTNLFQMAFNASCAYDLNISPAEGESRTVKAWMKDNKYRMEGSVQGQSGVYLLDNNNHTSYIYLPDQERAIKADYSQTSQMTPMSSKEGESVEEKFNIVGEETIAGKETVIVESNDGKTKMWMWVQNGLPLKTETTSSNGTTVVEVINVDCNKEIPDTKLSLPEGVEVMEMPMNF